MSAVETVQARIDAQQDYDALVYGLRNLGGRGYELLAAYGVAERVLGHYVQRDLSGAGLKRAKQAAAAVLLAAKDAEKAIGTKRQLRLTLAAESEDAGLALAA